MNLRFVGVSLLVVGLSVAPVAPLEADVTVRGRTVTTEAARGAGAGVAGALGALLGRGRGAGPQQTTTTEDFVMYYKDGRMRMDSGQHTMVLDPRPGSTPTMLMLDHSTRQAMLMTMADAAVAETLTSTTPAGATVTPAGGSREILGYDTRSYNFSVAIQSGMFTAGQAGVTPKAVNEGVAWIAADVPGLDEIRGFYRAFAAGVQGLGSELGTAGLTASQAAMAELGMPLETTTKTTASIEMGGTSMPMLSSTATSTVTSISTDPVSVEFYEDGPPAGYSLVQMAPGATPGTGVGRTATLPCDCSCEAYAEYRKLEAEAKRGNKEAEAELKKRMACMMQCVMQWAACGRR